MTYNTKKLRKLAEDRKRERKISDTRTPREKLITGDISKNEYMELIDNQQNKHGEK